MEQASHSLASSSPPPSTIKRPNAFASDAGSSSPAGPSSSHQRYDSHQRPPSSPLTPYSAAPKSVTPGSLVSPRHSKQYPIPSTTADVLETKRLAFFSRGRATQQQQQWQSSHANSSHNPEDGTLLRPGPLSASRRLAYKQPASTTRSSFPVAMGGGRDGDVSASLYRQRFRERCHAIMARQKGRSTALAKARGRDITSMDDAAEDEDEIRCLNSDDLVSSDMEEEKVGWWQEQDEELIRRVMLAEYRRLLINQEHSGQRELGWLDADEVAWLEDEARRDEQIRQGHTSNDSEEPPSDMIDEEAALYEQYQNAMQQQEHAGARREYEIMENDIDDDSLFEDPILSDLEQNSVEPYSGAQMDVS